MFFCAAFFVVLKCFIVFFGWPLLSISNACFDYLNQIDTLNDVKMSI